MHISVHTDIYFLKDVMKYVASRVNGTDVSFYHAFIHFYIRTIIENMNNELRCMLWLESKAEFNWCFDQSVFKEIY